MLAIFSLIVAISAIEPFCAYAQEKIAVQQTIAQNVDEIPSVYHPAAGEPTSVEAYSDSTSASGLIFARINAASESSETDAYRAEQGRISSWDSQYSYYGDSDGTRETISRSDIEVEEDGVRFRAISEDKFVDPSHLRVNLRWIEVSRPLGEFWTVSGTFGGATASGFTLSPIGSIELKGKLLGTSLEAMLKHGFDSTKAVQYGVAENEYKFEASRSFLGASAKLRISHHMVDPLFTNITVSGIELRLSRSIFGGFGLDAKLDDKRYSDHNNARTMEVSPRYTLKLSDATSSIGYRFGYQSFNQNSSGNYDAFEVVRKDGPYWKLSYKSPKGYYGSLELSGGKTLKRKFTTTIPSRHLSGSASATVGVHATDNISLEFSAEGANYGIEIPSQGWSYVSTAFRIKYSF